MLHDNRRRNTIKPYLQNHVRYMMSILSLCLILLGTGSLAQLNDAISPQQQKAMAAVSAFIADQKWDHADQMLREYGYKPANEANWKQYPVIRKLEAGYLAARTNNSPESGDYFLALLAQDMARRYQSVRVDENLKPYLKMKVSPDGLTFSPPTTPHDPATAVLPEPARKAVQSLAKFCDGNALGGARGFLTNYLGLSEDDAYGILRSSSTNEEAIQRGMAASVKQHGPVELKARLNQSVAELDRVFDGASQHETTFEPFRTHKAGTSDSIIFRDEPGPLTDPVLSHASGLPAPVETPTERYSHFVDKNYSGLDLLQFLAMLGGGGGFGVTGNGNGFGGVVFGSEVKADDNLSALKLKSMEWLHVSTDANGQSIGKMIFHFADPKNNNATIQRTYEPVLQEDAYAAREIVFGRYPGLHEWQPGQGIGLVGVTDRTPYFECGPDKLVNEGVRWRVIMHPALVNLELGWAALMVDVLPIKQKTLLDLARKNGTDRDYQAIESWLENTPGNWKFHETPLLIRMDAEHLTVLGMPDAGNPKDLRQAAYLDAEGYDFGGRDPWDKFSPAVVPLTKISSHYERINRFAAVLSLFRWAKSTHISPPAPIDRPAETHTPASIIIAEDGFFAAPDYKVEEIGSELQAKLDRQIANLTGFLTPKLRRALERYQDLCREEVEPSDVKSHAYIVIGEIRAKLRLTTDAHEKENLTKEITKQYVIIDKSNQKLEALQEKLKDMDMETTKVVLENSAPDIQQAYQASEQEIVDRRQAVEQAVQKGDEIRALLMKLEAKLADPRRIDPFLRALTTTMRQQYKQLRAVVDLAEKQLDRADLFSPEEELADKKFEAARKNLSQFLHKALPQYIKQDEQIKAEIHKQDQLLVKQEELEYGTLELSRSVKQKQAALIAKAFPNYTYWLKLCQMYAGTVGDR